MKKKKKLLRLFIETFYLSAFTFGGGYMIVSLMKKKFVNEYHWIEEDEMLDLVAIAQSAPGAIAVNGAIVVGYKLAGISGVIVSVFGAVLPPFLIISVVSVFYEIFRDNRIVAAMLSGMQTDPTPHSYRSTNNRKSPQTDNEYDSTQGDSSHPVYIDT